MSSELIYGLHSQFFLSETSRGIQTFTQEIIKDPSLVLVLQSQTCRQQDFFPRSGASSLKTHPRPSFASGSSQPRLPPCPKKASTMRLTNSCLTELAMAMTAAAGMVGFRNFLGGSIWLPATTSILEPFRDIQLQNTSLQSPVIPVPRP